MARFEWFSIITNQNNSFSRIKEIDCAFTKPKVFSVVILNYRKKAKSLEGAIMYKMHIHFQAMVQIVGAIRRATAFPSNSSDHDRCSIKSQPIMAHA